jgi:hypothetical protein
LLLDALENSCKARFPPSEFVREESLSAALALADVMSNADKAAAREQIRPAENGLCLVLSCT